MFASECLMADIKVVYPEKKTLFFTMSLSRKTVLRRIKIRLLFLGVLYTVNWIWGLENSKLIAPT